MKLVLYFARAYPGRSAGVLACLLLATLLEGISLGSLLPVLSIASGSLELGADRDLGDGEKVKGASDLEAWIETALATLGVAPSIGLLLAIMFGASVLKAVLVLIAKSQVGYTVAHVATDLRLALLRALLGARWSYTASERAGGAANAMATEADRASRAYQHLAQLSAYVFQALLGGALALAVSWRVTLAAAGASLLLVVALSALVRIAARAGEQQTRLLRSLLARLTDGLGLAKLLIATGREDAIGPLLEADARRLERALRRQVLSREALRALQEPLLVGVIALGLYSALVYWSIPLASAIVLVVLFWRTLRGVTKAQHRYQEAVIEASALWSLRDRIGRAEEQREARGGVVVPSLEHGIELDGVCVEYAGREVLSGVTLEIPAGQLCVLTGISGVGKTTLVDVVTGLVRPASGEVRIDGVPLAALDLARWRHLIGYVPQETLLLHDSVRTNLTLGDPGVDDADVERALREAGAWDLVAGRPEGLATSVGEHGALLSGGERQRLALARALVHEPRLLILDEATTGLDRDSEAGVVAALRRLRGRVTVLAISHHTQLAAAGDRVYRIEGGRVKRDADALPSHRARG